ncbi:MAG: hypothetical protein A2Y38_04565 [Spirochaetes bacterium GWB1_59_5]|nr:MAG: hypothetical protein A2Y38_04565 [Spirochaetes bacterium GWB1_59_5]
MSSTLSLEQHREKYYDAATGGYTYWPVAVLLTADPTDTLWKITDGYAHRPDLISAFFYGTPLLEWVIPMVNGMEDMIAESAADTVVLVPSKVRVLNALNAIA